jgi:hypothetical protein
MPDVGRVEIISTEFVSGWVTQVEGVEPLAYATVDNQVIGFAKAGLKRRDLIRLAAKGTPPASAFAIVFERPVPEARLLDVQVLLPGSNVPLKRAGKLRIDRTPKLQVFVLGSPRSGTSELGTTLSNNLALPWLGEGHAATLFAKAADFMSGASEADSGLIRFITEQDCRNVVKETTKRAYYYVHASASFLDKTPGVSMIAAAPFLLECFPDAKFIYLVRNGISNVLSRMQKFGGSFSGHCSDWASSVTEWLEVREKLPHYLEIRQETMLENPGQVAEQVCEYLGCPDAVAGVTASLQTGTRERTGAGIGRQYLAQTEWPPERAAEFRRRCGAAMKVYGYALDAETDDKRKAVA